MKKIAFGAGCGCIALFVCVIMLALYGRAAREEEAFASLSQAVDATMSSVMRGHAYTIEEKEAFTADFLKTLLIQMNSDSDLTVAILDADYELGLLSVEITETYRHPNGEQGSVAEVRTVIFDRKEERAPEYQTVGFYTSGDTLYKEYSIRKGTVCTVPAPPTEEGSVFRGWRFVSGGSGVAEALRISGKNGDRNVLASKGRAYVVSEDVRLLAVFDEM